MHQKKIICFDFDGTLVDSSVFVHSSLIKTAQDFGHSEINDNNLEEYFGPTEIGILKKILGPEEAIAASPVHVQRRPAPRVSLMCRSRILPG